ncbi:MAG: cytochrome bc1 complex cytochrome b subunit [Ferrimicrobium sp.]
MSTLEERAAKAADFADERLGIAKFARGSLNKIFPDHWSFMLGEIAMYSFVVLIFTGVFLTFFFVPSTQQVIYHGVYAPLRGQKMSQAFASTLHISFSVRAGLVMRQIHHWAADVFIAAIVVHLLRIFFTGAYRKPRELNWLIGSTLLILAIVNGFIGYSLPDDLISGTGIRIAFSILLSVPVVGSYLAFFIFGSNFPGNSIIPRFYILHVLILPALIAGLIGAHLAIMWHQKHTQYPGRGRTNRNVVGIPFWPAYALQAGGFFFITSAILAALGGIVQINPIWIYGPYVPYKVSYAVQPDWYMGWLDGALRLMPSWETVIAGHMIPNVFFPAVLLPGVTFGLLFAWPWIERRFTKDYAEHNLCDRPRERPRRTALGVGILTFYIVLFLASANDVLANTFQTSLNLVLWTLRIMLFVLPPVAGYVTYLLVREVESVPTIGESKGSVEISRTDEGAFEFAELSVRPPEEEVEELPEESAYQELLGRHAGETISTDNSGGSDGSGVTTSMEESSTTRERSGVLQVPRE